MPIEIKTLFYLHCDNCRAHLRPTRSDILDATYPLITLDLPLQVIHRALEQGWTLHSHGIYCPACTHQLKTAS